MNMQCKWKYNLWKQSQIMTQLFPTDNVDKIFSAMNFEILSSFC